MMSAEEKAAQLEKIFTAEEKRHEAIVKELQTLRDIQFKQTERIHELKHDDQTLLTTIQCLRHRMHLRHSRSSLPSSDTSCL